ncbi:MAG: ClpXP protease specificity-enhancing factor SspB, partial [Paracoccaceae bacterium]
MSNDFNYGQMMQKAMQGLLKSILQLVVDDGLPGKHHFYITFDTSHPGVEMAEWLKEAYPEEITIVMQEW